MNRLRPEHYEIARQRLAQHRRQAEALGGARQSSAERIQPQLTPTEGGDIWNHQSDDYVKTGNP